ncbi:glycoside hydrolase family 140 protein [Lachnospiraceae bacterium OttesenSCG-928-D06]|nr:glycoside hydrolase family 140 protein [Lachnospiraceae bacterium OttesenSCG-928-D06]
MKEYNKPWEYGALTTKEGSSYLFHGERLFFWLGDTAWLLLNELTDEEILVYLTNRAEKGFNVIQAVLVHHFPATNIYGKHAFLEEDVSRPDVDGLDSYWNQVDRVIKAAESLGLYMALLPHWGGLATRLAKNDMEVYVKFLAERYKNAPNIIWVTGGDTKGNEAEDYWRTMGKILKKECKNHLVTFHPFGRTSSIDYFPNEDWMDFHMFQSGHRRYDQRFLDEWDDVGKKEEITASRYYGEDNWRYVKDVLKSQNRKPVLDAEPSYEHIPQGLHQEKEPYWTTEQIRRYGWWSVLAGACGFTYGHNSIMQFYKGLSKGSYSVTLPWQDALHAPACDSMVHMKKIMESVIAKAWQDAKSCEEFLAGNAIWEEEQKEERIMAFHAGGVLLFYTYTGKTVEVNAKKIGQYLKEIYGTQQEGKTQEGKPEAIDAWWINPVSGVKSYIGEVKLTEEILSFSVPKGDDSHKDWLLMLG